LNKRVAVIPGDGIGPEIFAATLKVLNYMNLLIDFVKVESGKKSGKNLENHCLKRIWRS